MVEAASLEAVSVMADAVAGDLLMVRHSGDSSFINLPIAYTSGTFVTVKIARVRDGVRVSDGGFAYRELESIGAERSFSKTALGTARAKASMSTSALYLSMSQGAE